MSLTRDCTRCKQTKEISDFPIDARNSTWVNRVCKKCNGIRSNENKRKNPHWTKKYNWKRRGWTESEIDLALIAVSCASICEICEDQLEHPHVDHCHTSGKFRGVLCHRCNRALGFFKDDPGILRKAANYVDKHSKVVYNG